MIHVPILQTAAESLGSKLLVAAVAPILGGLIIGGAIQWVAWKAQTRRDERDIRYQLVKEMSETSNALYMATQLYWRVSTGRDVTRRHELAELRRRLDEQYEASRSAGLVLESQLDAYFVSDLTRQRWHRTMDFLTVRYYQVLEPDMGSRRASRLSKLYEQNAKDECTGVDVNALNSAQIVLQGYRQALSEASILALTEAFRTPSDLRNVVRESSLRAQARASAHPSVEAADEPKGHREASRGAAD